MSLTRNAVLNALGGVIIGAQDYSIGWALAASTVTGLALSSKERGNILPASASEAERRAVLPMFSLCMLGWVVGRALFPPPPA